MADLNNRWGCGMGIDISLRQSLNRPERARARLLRLQGQYLVNQLAAVALACEVNFRNYCDGSRNNHDRFFRGLTGSCGVTLEIEPNRLSL